MRVPLSWLADYVAVELAPEALAERLTLLGMEVKSIERRGTEWRNVVVGELLAVEKHPRADRLSLTRVTTGTGEPLEIVCGATNIAVGQRVPVALPGAVLPGDRRIERTEKMGVVSNGMLCSGEELGLTADGDGILILDPATPIGTPLGDLFGDVVLDIDVKPNRGDALSMIGIAREVSAAMGAEMRWPEIEVAESEVPVGQRLRVDVEAPQLCSRFVGRWVSGVQIGPSPDRIQMRLLAAGMRPVNNVVDASNYVMLELGKPIHTFDAAAVGDGRIVVRLARDGEGLVTLDHVERALTPDTLVIAAETGPIGIAGVMGGAASEIATTTTDVVIESAIFDPVSIRRTAFRYALRSEASLRFEKGQEFRLARLGADRTAQLIAEWAGGAVAAGRVDTNPAEPGPRRVAFRPARVDRLLGTALGEQDQRGYLARVGVETEEPTQRVEVPIAVGLSPAIAVAPAGTAVVALVPTWRRDIEIEADLAEEIARIRGYELVPATLPDTAMPPWRPSPLEVRDAVREALVGAGLTEVATHALVSARHLASFPWSAADIPAAGEAARAGGPIAVTNPLSQDHAHLRQSLVGSLADAVSTNVRRGRPDVAIFEVGKGYGRVDDRPHEWWRLGLALAGSFEPAAWNRAARGADIDDAKGVVELLAKLLGASRPTYEPLTDEPMLHPGRSARASALAADGSLAISGFVGELHPSLLQRWDLRIDRLVIAELSVMGLGGGQLADARSVPPSRFPPVERDLAIVIGPERFAGEVEAVIRESGGSLLADVVLFDVYRGRPLEPGERSLAYRLRFAADDRTLTESEVEAAVASITTTLTDRLGARIRV
jgi:phenylalanyl-tRNA synthetase beta chain